MKSQLIKTYAGNKIKWNKVGTRNFELSGERKAVQNSRISK